MRIPAVLFSILLFTTVFFAQEPEPTATPAEGDSVAVEVVEDAGSVFESASAERDPAIREKALLGFLKKFPESEPVGKARELLTATRAELAAAALKAGDRDEAFRLFRLAISEAPSPVSDKLFSGVLLQIPNNLFFGGLREPAYELAGLIEEKSSTAPRQLLALATFYISVEDAQAARRLAEKAISLAPDLPSAYQTLGLASRLGFDLTGAEGAYARALELDPASISSRRSLAELKRAVGKPNESIALYDEIIATDASDANAGTGRTLALYGSGRLSEAESAKDTLLAVNPKNLALLTGAAYWYAAHRDPEKAILHANGALAVEPRFTWAHIALARGLMESGRPLDAERVLLNGRQYGNFPTLEYELAAARLGAGFYRDASDVLVKNFSISDGQLKAMLGGRVEKKAEDFINLLALERQASIFEPASADDPQSAERLKRLLKFVTVLEAGNAPGAVASAADEFIEGTDPMKIHRQLFVAGRMLEKKVALESVEKITGEAGGGVEESLNVPTAAAAVLAEELYESRKIGIARGSLVVVPEIPRQTLSRVLRGRIEELNGWARFLQGNNAEAEVRLKRALSILPRDSAWSRSAYWRMGTVLETVGRREEALENYIAGYRGGGDDPVRKIVVEGLYKRLNGSLDGLEEKLRSGGEEPSTISRFMKEGEKPAPVKAAEDFEPVADSVGNSADEPAGKEEETKVEDGPPDSKAGDEKVAEPAASAETEDRPVDDAPKAVGDTQAEPIEGDLKAEPLETDSAVPSLLPEDIERANREAMEKLDVDSPLGGSVADDAPKESVPVLAAEASDIHDGDSPIDDSTGGEADKDPIAANPSDGRSGSEKPAETVSGQTGDQVENPKLDEGSGGAETPKSSSIRPRLVPDERSRIAGDKETGAPCSIVLSQDAVMISPNGGSVGLVAGIEGRTGVFSLKAVSSSPGDLAVYVDSAAAEIAGKAVFVVRSVSSAKGIFTVSFQSSCGSKDVRVTVR